MKKTINKVVRLLIMIVVINNLSCSEYLDVVPEGTATLDNAFSMRRHTLRYLTTCYSYLPTNTTGSSIDIMGADEVWVSSHPQYPQGINRTANWVARGLLTTSNSIMGTWSTYYTAIRDCNSFLEGMETHVVPDLLDFERLQFIAEAKALKAYYHFLLLRQYGPIPVVKENLPVSTGVFEVQVPRNTVDEVVDYIVELLDEAIEDLPVTLVADITDLGRITKSIALFLKAEVLVTAASPLFNCNEEFAPMKNRDGTQLFPQDKTQQVEKWKRAAEACGEAVDFCLETLKLKLYTFPGDAVYALCDTLHQQMTLRQAFCEEWNSELIWADTRSWVSKLQEVNTSPLNPLIKGKPQQGQYFSVPIKIPELFYTDNGVPIDEDVEWDYENRFESRQATRNEGFYIRSGSKTAACNFNREPRFYAWLGFSNGICYGYGAYVGTKQEELFSYGGGKDRISRIVDGTADSEPTGYVPKKWVHYKTLNPTDLVLTIETYIWPRYRLAELFLFYAEALNEADNTQAARDEAMKYLDMIRERAGLKPVKTAWSMYSKNPEKHTTQAGLREIIRQERTIELVFEGKRFWDLRRWKTAREVLNQPIQGFNVSEDDYYGTPTIFKQKFGLKDYFWPISDAELNRNQNLVQSLGW